MITSTVLFSIVSPYQYSKYLIFIIFLLNPFQVIISQIRHVNVDLKKEVNVNIDFDEDLVDFEFYSLANLKKYEKAILLNYKGIPKSDSLKIYIYNLDNTQFYFDIYREEIHPSKKPQSSRKK